MDLMSEAKVLRDTIAEIVRSVLVEETKDCFRVKKAILLSAPSGGTCQVRFVGDSSGSVTIPYAPRIRDAYVGGTLAVNQAVWVAIPYSSDKSERNAIVWETGSFQ